MTVHAPNSEQGEDDEDLEGDPVVEVVVVQHVVAVVSDLLEVGVPLSLLAHLAELPHGGVPLGVLEGHQLLSGNSKILDLLVHRLEVSVDALEVVVLDALRHAARTDTEVALGAAILDLEGRVLGHRSTLVILLEVQRGEHGFDSFWHC